MFFKYYGGSRVKKSVPLVRHYMCVDNYYAPPAKFFFEEGCVYVGDLFIYDDGIDGVYMKDRTISHTVWIPMDTLTLYFKEVKV